MYDDEGPKQPLDSDCCGGGCQPCVFDVYEQQLAAWRKSGKAQRPTQDSFVLSQLKFTPFVLTAIESKTQDTNLYSFEAKCGRMPLGIGPGQYVILQGHVGEKPVSRPYSPVSEPECEQQGKLQVLIKLYEGGTMSQYVATLQPSSVVLWRGPFDSVHYRANASEHLLMLCCGTGVAPLYRLARHIVYDEEDYTRLHMLFGCRTLRDVLLRDELQRLAAFWNFSYCLHLSRECSDMRLRYGESAARGRVSAEDVTREICGRLPSVRVMVCGTESFSVDMQQYCTSAGLSQADIVLL